MTDLNAGGSVEALVALVHVLLGRLVVELPDVLGQVLLRDRLKSNKIAVKEQNLDILYFFNAEVLNNWILGYWTCALNVGYGAEKA